MAARTLPESSFSDLLRRRLARTLGGGALVAGLALMSGCERSDLVCFDSADARSCEEQAEFFPVGESVCADDGRWEITAYIETDGECCAAGQLLADAAWCAPSSPPPPGVSEPVDGRPLILEGEARTARLRRTTSGDGWCVASPADLADLSPSARTWMAERWHRAARMEHASIASFAKFSLDLIAHAAPPDLLLAAHAAAADEVRHARACLSLAAACSGEPVAPDAIVFPGGRVDLQTDLAAFAVDVVREGCIGETLAAIRAAEQLVGAKDVAVARVLTTIVEDESRHAELAWRTVRWALSQGDARVREAVAAAFAEAPAMARTSGRDHTEDLTAWGFPKSARVEAALQRAVAEVIAPAAEALLRSAPSAAEGSRCPPSASPVRAA